MALTYEAIVEQIKEVLEMLEPYFLMHGGNITFDRFEHESGTLFVKLEGSCNGCSASGHTLKMLVEAEMKKEVPQVLTVVESE